MGRPPLGWVGISSGIRSMMLGGRGQLLQDGSHRMLL